MSKSRFVHGTGPSGVRHGPDLSWVKTMAPTVRERPAAADSAPAAPTPAPRLQFKRGQLTCPGHHKQGDRNLVTALARLVVNQAVAAANGDNRLPRTLYRCRDPQSNMAHYHPTHWAAPVPNGRAWPSPFHEPAPLDPQRRYLDIAHPGGIPPAWKDR